MNDNEEKLVRPSVRKAFIGVLSEVYENQNNARTLIVESGVLGGDVLPASAMDTTRAEIEKVFDKIAQETGDDVDVRIVGSARFGSEGAKRRATFGDIDIILKMEKIETLSRIKKWVFDDDRTSNIRDVKTMKSGDDLDPDSLGDQFSFLFPIYKEPGKPVSLSELEFALRNRFDQTTWKTNHDERMRLDSNLKNLSGKSGIAMVQVDVMRCVVGGIESKRLMQKAEELVKHLDKYAKDGKMDEFSEYVAWLNKYITTGEVQEFEDHYKFLKGHQQLQNTEDQKLLAAIHMIQNNDEFKESMAKKFGNTEYRYSFHPDALQIIYYLASQLGVVLDDENFDNSHVTKLINMGVRNGILKEPKVQRTDGTPLPPAEQKRLSIAMLRDPTRLQEAVSFFKGKHKDELIKAIIRQTRNKRADETNKAALFRNYGSRNVKRV